MSRTVDCNLGFLSGKWKLHAFQASINLLNYLEINLSFQFKAVNDRC